MDVVDLCDSDEDVAVVANPGVARMPSPRSRKRNAEDHDSDIEVVESPVGNRKRGRANVKANLKSDDDDIEFLSTMSAPTPKPLPKTPLQHILDVFPDVLLTHAKSLLQKHNNIPANVMNEIIENLPYPKEEGKKPAAVNRGVDNMATVKKPTYDFMSASSFQPSKGYIEQSTDQLVRDFPGLSKKGAKYFLEKSNNHYAIAHSNLFRALTDTSAGKASLTNADNEIGQYEKLKDIKAGKVFGEDQKKGLKELLKCSPRKDHFLLRRRTIQNNDLNIVDPILLEEIAFVKRKQGEWKDSVETKIQLKINRELAVKDGTAFECTCCFLEVAMEELVACRDGHLFCQGCLEQYLTNSVFSNQSFGKHPKSKEENLELVCFIGEGCSFGFERCYLVRALKPKVLEKYDELCAMKTIEKAGLRDEMCTCPSCGYSASLAETDNVFSCPACQHESCRHCQEPSHIPLRCDEVEKKQEETARTRVEEAASNAVIRFCPKCKKGVIKSDGCNKMTCACGVKWCYLCRALVKDYTHFCQIPHCTHSGKKKCNGCPLWTKDLDEAHEKERRAAAVAEASRVEAEATTSTAQPAAGLFTAHREASSAKEKVHIDVDSILKAPKPSGRAH